MAAIHSARRGRCLRKVLGILEARAREPGSSKSNVNDLATLLRPLIREVADFPQAGVLFRDLAPVFADAAAFRAVVDGLIIPDQQIDVVIGVEARGFLLGAAGAYA